MLQVCSGPHALYFTISLWSKGVQEVVDVWTIYRIGNSAKKALTGSGCYWM